VGLLPLAELFVDVVDLGELFEESLVDEGELALAARSAVDSVEVAELEELFEESLVDEDELALAARSAVDSVDDLRA
jgi:hypothetical protein